MHNTKVTFSRFHTIKPTPIFVAALIAIGFASNSERLPAQAPKAAPIFKDGQAQNVPAFSDRNQWISHHLWVETEFDSDGNGTPDRMHVDVTRQRQTETEGLKVPVIYETSPYYSGTGGNGTEFFWNPDHELNETPPERKLAPGIKHQGTKTKISSSLIRSWLPRGFAVVHSCSPGTGRSQGCPTIGGDNESLAPKAVVDWLNGRAKGYTAPVGGEEVKADWCTGKVGMTGTSYNGTLPIACATTGVEGLEAIIPIAPNTSYYHYYRSNGLVRHPGGYMGEDIDVLYDFINSGPTESRNHCDCKVRDEVLTASADRLSGDYNDFWAGRDYLRKLDKYKAATLIAHGFNDWNVMPEHSIRVFQALRAKGVPCQGFFHQGNHGGGGPTRQMMNRWFTRYLYGVQNGVEDDAKAWIVRTGDGRRNPTAYPDYPNPDAKAVTLFPGGNGSSLGQLGFGVAGADSKQALIDDVSLKGKQLAMASQSQNRLLFATPPLTKPLHISGTPKLNIKLASSKPAANLSVWVVSLPWDPNSRQVNDNIITRGWADPQNHKSMTESEPLVPGQYYELSFDLQPDDQVIPAGQQIGLMIFSSDREFTLWPDPGTQLTVDLSATSLELPIVGGKNSLPAMK